MTHNDQRLTTNELAFIALANEYCHALETAAEADREHLVATMLRLLPRIYMAASDLEREVSYSDYELEAALEEPAYDQVRDLVSQIMADEDIYLEVFMSDMKYSDTPISTSVSENLADLYQEFFNFIVSVRDATTEAQLEMLALEKGNFQSYWGITLCNVLRALHTIYYNIDGDDL